jgi:SAM-dependent methyltransferase
LRRSLETSRFRLIPGGFPQAVPEAEKFDVITMLAVVEHLPADSLHGLAAACARRLRPGGRVVITVPSAAVDVILHWLIKLRLIAGIGVHEHHGFRPDQVPRLFAGAGFQRFSSRRFQLGLNNLFVFTRLPRDS